METTTDAIAPAPTPPGRRLPAQTGTNETGTNDTFGTATPEEVRERTLSGVRWGVLARLGAETTALLSSVVLARLVGPSGFGHAVVAVAVIALSQALVIEGFGTPLVQRRAITRAHLETTALLSISAGVLLTVLVYLVAPLLDGILSSQTASLIRLASPSFLIVSLAVLPQALAQRRMDFRTTSMIEMVSTVIGIALSVALAAIGLGGTALVLGQLAIPAAMAAMYLKRTPLVAPRWHPEEARELWAFGAQTSASSLLQSAWTNLDYVVVAAVLGPVATGYYWRAFQVGGEYQGKISTIMIRLALPVLSRTRGLEEMRGVRNRIVRSHALVIFPLLTTYILVAPQALPLAFGSEWSPAVVPSQILAVAGMVFALAGGQGPLLVAAGHPRAQLVSNLLNTLTFAAVVVVFARFGVTPLCIAVAGINLAFYLGQYHFLLQRLVGIPMSDLWREISPALTSLAPLLAAGGAAGFVVSRLGVPALAQILLTAGVASIAYLASLRRRSPDAWADLRLLFERAVGRTPRPAPDAAPASRLPTSACS